MADFESAVNAYNSGDHSTGINMLKQLSEQGEAQSQYSLGRLYEAGANVDQDIDEAVRLYILSAESGNIEAQHRLGGLYYVGESVERDFAEARKWMELTARNKNSILGAVSAFTIGTMYLFGEGVPESADKANEWFERVTGGAPRIIISDHFKSMDSELPIKGGWGYTKDSACIIDKNDPVVDTGIPFDGVGIEHIFVEKRIYEEMIITRPIGEAYSGAEWKLLSQELIEDNDRYYDYMKFSVTAFHDSDWEELKAEWEGRNDNSQFSSEDHQRKREERLVRFDREFWFDITSFFGQEDVTPISSKSSNIEDDEVISTFFGSQDEAIKFLVQLKEARIASPNGKYIATLKKEEAGKWLYVLYNTQEDLYVGDYVSSFRCTKENVDLFNKGVKYLADLLIHLEGLPENERDNLLEKLADQNAFGEIGYKE